MFPLQKRSVLELVLHGCNGDIARAIEHFLSAQDTVSAQSCIKTQQQHQQQPGDGAAGREEQRSGYLASQLPQSASMGDFSASNKLIKSAFGTLGQPSAMHTAFPFKFNQQNFTLDPTKFPPSRPHIDALNHSPYTSPLSYFPSYASPFNAFPSNHLMFPQFRRWPMPPLPGLSLPQTTDVLAKSRGVARAASPDTGRDSADIDVANLDETSNDSLNERTKSIC